MVYSGGRYVNYRYNAEGSLAELDYGEGDAAPTATYRFEYDSLGRLIRSQQRDGNTVTQRTEQLYDTANRLSAQGWTLGGTSYRESYDYDASDGSLTTLNTAVGTKIGYNYDALKRLRSRAIYQGSTPLFENRYAYATQSGNQSTALVEFFNYRLASDDGNGDIIVGYRYEYDNGGNITDIKAEVDGALIPLEHYEYDEKQGQLKTAIRYENGEEADRWTYSYDTAGNILSEDHEGINSELHEYAYEDGRWGDLLTSVDGIGLEYDGSGNPTLYANGTELLWNMEWQNGRQLSRAATERDSTTEDVLDFAYDANGIRTRKTVTRNTYRPVQTYKVTFVADGKTVKTMNVTEGYTLKDSDYPAVPEKAGYTGAWQRYTSPVQSNVTVSVTYTKITTYYTVTFVADGETVKTISVRFEFHGAVKQRPRRGGCARRVEQLALRIEAQQGICLGGKLCPAVRKARAVIAAGNALRRAVRPAQRERIARRGIVRPGGKRRHCQQSLRERVEQAGRRGRERAAALGGVLADGAEVCDALAPVEHEPLRVLQQGRGRTAAGVFHDEPVNFCIRPGGPAGK